MTIRGERVKVINQGHVIEKGDLPENFGRFVYMNIALLRSLHNHGNIATEESPKPGLCPTSTLISNDFKGSL